MPRVMGINIPGRKRVVIALRYIYGIGPTLAERICQEADLDPDKKADDLTDVEVTRIAQLLQKSYRTEGDLRREVTMNIRRLVAIGCYRGSRHRRGLPCRGQRTKTNARTRKGPKRTVGAVRDKASRQAMKT